MNSQNANNPYYDFIDIANKTDRAAEYLSQGKLRIDQAPIDAILGLYEKLAKEGLTTYEDLGNLLNLYKSNLSSGDVDGIAALLHLTSSEIKRAIERYNSISEMRKLVSETGYLHNNERIMYHGRRSLPEGVRPFSGKGVVYSCITGGYDEIRNPAFITPGLDYVFFTDDASSSSDMWDVRIADNPDSLTPRALARRIKILPWEYLPGYDFSVWIDGKIQSVSSLTEYISTYGISESILCFNHYECRNLSDEAKLIIDFGKESPEIVNTQLDTYASDGYPDDNGAVDTCILVREHGDPILRQTMHDWWHEISTQSMRDQLSFNYVCWKNNLVYDTSPLYVYDNPYFKAYAHN